MKGDCTPIEDEAPNSYVNPSGRARRQKGWWKRGVVDTQLNTVNMTAWVHKECDIMEEDALLRLQGAWDNPQQKDECSVRMDDMEWNYWKRTEVGQLGGYGFQGAIFGVDGSCKDGKMGSGCCKFQGEEADKCAWVSREEEGMSSNMPELGGFVLALQSACAQCGRIAYATPSESKWGGLNLSKSNSSKALDRTSVVLPQPFCPVLCCCCSCSSLNPTRPLADVSTKV
jgi:hypothetical protein